MPSDSKLYVYLDPARFLADTTTTFDPRQYAGWVPHQHIAYLWPTGPWFWFVRHARRARLDRPPAVDRHAARSPPASACAGWRGCSGSGPTAALAAAIVYQLSPYILPYVSRTSILLLP